MLASLSPSQLVGVGISRTNELTNGRTDDRTANDRQPQSQVEEGGADSKRAALPSWEEDERALPEMVRELPPCFFDFPPQKQIQMSLPRQARDKHDETIASTERVPHAGRKGRSTSCSS